MAVPTHFRFTCRGLFTATPEQWSFGFHMSRINAAAADAGLDDIDQAAVTSAFTAFIGSGNGIIDSGVKMTDWRAYQIGTNGRMQGNPLIVDVAANNIVGTGTIRYPSQIALVATFVANNRGPARFGRFFIPGPAKPLDGSRRLVATDAQQYDEHVTALLKSVSDAIDMQGLLSATGLNVSPSGNAGVGTLQEIDHVEIGRALDTMRSRRTSLLEERFVGGHIDW